jgi:hypothetical protein
MLKACGQVMDKLWIGRVEVSALCAVSPTPDSNQLGLYADSTVVELLYRLDIPRLFNKLAICFLDLYTVLVGA